MRTDTDVILSVNIIVKMEFVNIDPNLNRYLKGVPFGDPEHHCRRLTFLAAVKISE